MRDKTDSALIHPSDTPGKWDVQITNQMNVFTYYNYTLEEAWEFARAEGFNRVTIRG